MSSTADFQAVAEAAVREAGAFLRANLDRRPEASYKGAVDLVTECDLAAQEILAGRLTGAFPDHGILAEEGLARPGRSGHRWVVDPLDGTTNFAHTFPVFSVSAALEERGRVVLGLVYDPMRDEMFSAREGLGAFLNGRRIRVSAVDDLGRSLLATGFPYDVRTSPVNNLGHWSRFLVRAQAVRRCGSAAMDLCYVACGRFDGFWELKLKPWDVAAGVLIVREAGGLVTGLDGGEHGLETSDTLATNGLIHRAMLEVLGLGPALDEGGRVHG
ncbi:MAG TPA: inositol monophosphatase family protein [Burkholderiales bacterium]|nr:inositol monophosphatase family protein [Burkholderiales bacterium]